MLRLLAAIVGGAVASFILGVIVGWLARRPRPSPIAVMAVVNTALLSAVALTIIEFQDYGLGVHSVVFAVLAFLFCAAAVNAGNVALRMIRSGSK